MTLDEIAQKIQNKPKSADFPIKLVAIDGHGGSGKSTLAAKLAKKLGAEVLHTDDFASWDNPQDWWPRLISEVFDPISHGVRKLNYERSKWSAEHNPKSVKDQKVTKIMLMEGVSSARKEFRPYLSYAIWVETPLEICIKRGIERDGEHMRQQWEKWLKEEDEFIKRDNPRAYADLKVSGV